MAKKTNAKKANKVATSAKPMTTTAATTKEVKEVKPVETIKETVEKAAEKVVEKAPEVKEAAKKAVKETAKATKTVAAKAAKEVKEETKKATKTVKKAAAKKAEVVVETYFEFGGKQVMAEELVERIKEAYKADGHRVSAIKTLRTYVNPEENRAYYVINDKAEDKYIEL